MDHRLSAAMRISAFLTMMYFAGLSSAQTVATPTVTTAAPTLVAVPPPSAPGGYYARPSWDQSLPCTALATCPRFVVLSNMNNEAVLDVNTGLVWQRSPATTTLPWLWASAYCAGQWTGGVLGWRLPRVQELASLTDLSVYAMPPPTSSTLGMRILSPGHPFLNVLNGYWTATTFGPIPANAYYVAFERFRTLPNPIQQPNPFNMAKTSAMPVWCVRGGAGGDVQ